MVIIIQPMKKYIFIILCCLTVFSCKKNKGDEPESASSIIGEWILSSYETKAVTIGTESIDIYIQFDSKGFFLYQKLGSGRYKLFTGTYSLTGTTLSGKYSDGKAWGSSYSVSIKDKNLILISQPNGSEVHTFISTTIPESVKNNIY